MRKELAEGRSWNREEVSAEEAKRYFASRARTTRSSSSTPPKGRSRFYTQGDFTDLCRGPHLQNSKPIKAVKLTGLAGAYWRGDEHNKQLTRIYGTAFYSQDDLDAYLERLEEARQRDHRRLGTQLDLFHLSDHAARDAVLAPEGDGHLEHARGPAAARERQARLRRGQDAAALRRRAPGRPRATGRSSRTTCSSSPTARTRTLGLKPMNCPGHMLLFGIGLRSYRDLPLRYAESSTLHRNERAGTLHGLLRVQHVTQDDAHLFVHAGADRGRDLRAASTSPPASTTSSALEARFELSTRPGEQARHRRGVGLHRGRAALGARAPRDRVHRQRGRRRVLRAEDRPAHDRRPRPLLADGDDPARLPDAGPVRPHLHGRRQRASTRRTSSTAPSSARSSASSGS